MNIVLCGFMGCGKTTVGKRLAKELGRKFYDTDDMIVEEQGKSITKIFEEVGECGFREIEKSIIKKASQLENAVIATGGGVVLNSENVETLKITGKIVFIDVTAQMVIARLKNNKTRPLLQRPDKEKVIEKMLTERRPKYLSAADYTIVPQYGGPNEVVKCIKMQLNL